MDENIDRSYSVKKSNSVFSAQVTGTMYDSRTEDS